MSFRYKSLESVNQQDLKELITNKVSEAKYLDYKMQLPLNADKSKKEFLADVSSFANAVGGHLIYGIEEKGGVPTKPNPIMTSNPDADIRRLESMILNGIRPRIPGIDTQDVEYENGYVFIIRVPPSPHSPHMVTFGGHDKFYSRNSRGKYPLTVDEIRMAFIQSETFTQKIRNHRHERIDIISRKMTPVSLREGPKLALHLVPFGAFGLAEGIDIRKMIAKRDQLQPMGFGGCDYRPNIDGYLAFMSEFREPSLGYVQVFRNGCIESVRTLLSPISKEKHPQKLDGYGIENMLLDSIPSYMQILNSLGVSLPIIVMITLLEMKDISIVIRGFGQTVIPSEYGVQRPIDRNTLLIPEIMLEVFEADYEEVLEQSFHTIWNAAGWTGSPAYDEKGKRTKGS
jgi:hypothetical protein